MLNTCPAVCAHLAKEIPCNEIKATETTWIKWSPLRSARNLQRRKKKLAEKEKYFLTFSFGSRFMVFKGLSTRRTRRDLMVLMSLPLVPLQGRKRHKNNRGNHLLPRSLTGIFVGVQGGSGGGIGWVWGWFCVHPRQGCRQDDPASPGTCPAAQRSRQGQDKVLAGLSHSCWPGFGTTQPLTRTWGPSCTNCSAPRQGSSTRTGAQLLHPILAGGGTEPQMALPSQHREPGVSG